MHDKPHLLVQIEAYLLGMCAYETPLSESGGVHFTIIGFTHVAICIVSANLKL